MSSPVQKRERIVEKTQQILQALRAELPWQDILELYDHTVELIDVEPEQKLSEVPVLLVPGFSGNAGLLREHAHAMAQHGRRTLCVNSPHGIDILDQHTEASHDLPMPQMRKALAILGTLDKKGIEKIDVVGYSEASITMTVAAILRPELFRSLVLMNPAGLYGTDTVAGLGFRLGLDKIHELWKLFLRWLRDPIGGKKMAHYALGIHREKKKTIWSDPLQSAREIQAISQTMITQWLVTLQKEHSIGIVVAQSDEDKLFPRDRVSAFCTKAQIPQGNILFDLKGTHDAVLLDPEHAMEVANRAILIVERRA